MSDSRRKLIESLPLVETNFIGLENQLVGRGKVRDIYDLGDNRLLIITTDRISVFDVVVGAIPGKGRVLTSISRFWFEQTAGIIPNHLVSTSVDDLPEAFQKYRNILEGRIMIVEEAEVLPIECIVRGYLDGSALTEYRQTGRFLDHDLPPGLVQGSKFRKAIFTPSTKALAGKHDQNITFEQMVTVIGGWLDDASLSFNSLTLSRDVRSISLNLYEAAVEIAREKGINLLDTKLEVAIRRDGSILLVDEAFTPDSSRFELVSDHQEGRPPISLDKQPVRDYFESIGRDMTSPLPADVVEKTTKRYQDLEAMLLG
jgi:phosphoribosylaminoimidazole-succinocarboxamide synthase